MKFIDELVIQVESGKGGDGMVAFRREKFVPYGGPSGGDGGRGGDIILEATAGLNTLYELSYKRKHKAESGEKGRAKDQYGADASSTTIKLPIGTLVYNADTDDLLADLDKDGTRFIVAKGGKGGRGNAKFANSVRRAPRIAEKGEPGRHLRLRLELKLLADVGLVGLPNAGKSTLLSVVSNARPKIADYPFTTLVPNLGIVKPEHSPSFCMADLPGLIEGAHEGAGLGIQFLKHVERTRVFVHLVDMSVESPEEAIGAFENVMNEVYSFNPSFKKRPMLIVGNKMDIPQARENFPVFQKKLKKKGFPIRAISGASQTGIPELLDAIGKLLEELPQIKLPVKESVKKYTYLPSFVIDPGAKHTWMVSGSDIEKLVQMTDFTSDEAIGLFKKKLKTMGFLDELARCKGEDEDSVFIGDMEFSYWEFFR